MCISIKDKYIDPFTDFGFKHIFGTEKNKKLLISFLNDILELKDKIVDIEYRSLEKLGLKIYDRKAIFDVYCTDTKDNKFIVELQKSEQKYFKDRSIYYTTFPIQEQAKKGAWNYQLTKIYFIGILDFSMDIDLRYNKSKEDDRYSKYLTKVKLCDEDTKDIFYDKLTYIYLEMPKFRKTEQELSSHLDKWLYYLKNLNDVTSVPKILQNDDIFKEAFDVAEFLALDSDEQFAYQQDLKAKWDNYAVMEFAKEKAEFEGMQKGIKKGIKKGLEKGMKEGLEKGKAEGEKNAKLEVAKKLLDILDIEMIALKTGLTQEDITKLKEKNEN